jgi:hypothetical protein
MVHLEAASSWEHVQLLAEMYASSSSEAVAQGTHAFVEAGLLLEAFCASPVVEERDQRAPYASS